MRCLMDLLLLLLLLVAPPGSPESQCGQGGRSSMNTAFRECSGQQYVQFKRRSAVQGPELLEATTCSLVTALVEHCGAVWARCHTKEEVTRMREMQVQQLSRRHQVQASHCQVFQRYLSLPASVREQCSSLERDLAQREFSQCSQSVHLSSLSPLPHLHYPQPLSRHLCHTLERISSQCSKFLSACFTHRDTEVVLHSHLEEMTEYLEQFLHTLSPTASLSCPTEERPGEEPWEGPGEGPEEEPGEEPWEGPGEEPGEGPRERQGRLESLESGDARVVLDEAPWPAAAPTVNTPPSLHRETDHIPLPPPKLTDIKEREDWEDSKEGRRNLARQSQDREGLLGPSPTSSALSFPSSSYSSSTSYFSSCTSSSYSTPSFPSSSSLSSPLRSPLPVLATLSWIQNTL